MRIASQTVLWHASSDKAIVRDAVSMIDQHLTNAQAHWPSLSRDGEGLQMIREAVEKHTGVKPPEMLPEPVGKAYGKVLFQLAAPLTATLPYIPGAGDGIPTKHPEPMEHYDMG